MNNEPINKKQNKKKIFCIALASLILSASTYTMLSGLMPMQQLSQEAERKFSLNQELKRVDLGDCDKIVLSDFNGLIQRDSGLYEVLNYTASCETRNQTFEIDGSLFLNQLDNPANSELGINVFDNSIQIEAEKVGNKTKIYASEQVIKDELWRYAPLTVEQVVNKIIENAVPSFAPVIEKFNTNFSGWKEVK